jgi:hypothetical protein
LQRISKAEGSRRKGGYSTPNPVIERLRSPNSLLDVVVDGGMFAVRS